MTKLLTAAIAILLFVAPLSTSATYGLTKSLHVVSASSQYARSASPTGFPSGAAARTIEFCFKYAGAAEQVIVGYGTDSGSQAQFNVSLDTAAELWIRLNGGNIHWTATGAADGEWHHAAVTHDGSASVSSSATKAYLDVSDLGSGTTGGTATVNTTAIQATVGASSDNTAGSFLNGDVSLVRVWSVARSQSDISTNKCNVLGATSNLVAEWTLDNVYTDNSGTGNTLTSSGSPTFLTDTPAFCAVPAAASFNFWQFLDF